jgi:hypothetical protein
MRTRSKSSWLRAGALITALAFAFGGSVSAGAGKSFEGQWLLQVTIPTASGSSETTTFTIHIDAGPRGDTPMGRAVITDDQGQAVGGVWRQVKKKVSLTYEPPCSGDEGAVCATLILQGKIKSKTTFKKGAVIVMWDTPNDNNPALYDTSNGKFSGDRVQ